MRIFVTGGSGFVGGAIGRSLSQEHQVWGMARSDAAAERVRQNGMQPVSCNLSNVNALHLQDAEVVIHAAAHVAPYGRWRDFKPANVDGTARLLEAARISGIRRFIHISTEAVIFYGFHLHGANEQTPFPAAMPFNYGRSKQFAERLVTQAHQEFGLETIVLRPRFVWGPEDTNILPGIVKLIDSGKWRWIGAGRNLTHSCHIDNLVHAIRLSLRGGQPGEAYFITDDEAVTMRELISGLARATGREPGEASIPRQLALTIARKLHSIWRTFGLKRQPPIAYFSVAIMAYDCLLDISKARHQLGYAPVVNIENGLKTLAEWYARERPF